MSVVRVSDTLTKRDLGDFSHITHIRPARDGSFLVTAQTRRGSDERGMPEFVGAQIWPDEGRVNEIWRFTTQEGVNSRTDYLPELMIGVSTSHTLGTRITDLHTGKVTRTINNSANYRPVMLSTSSREGGDWPRRLLIWGGVVLVGLFVVGIAVLIRRRRRIA